MHARTACHYCAALMLNLDSSGHRAAAIMLAAASDFVRIVSGLHSKHSTLTTFMNSAAHLVNSTPEQAELTLRHAGYTALKLPHA